MMCNNEKRIAEAEREGRGGWGCCSTQMLSWPTSRTRLRPATKELQKMLINGVEHNQTFPVVLVLFLENDRRDRIAPLFEIWPKMARKPKTLTIFA